jgi:hypothetical protein
VNKIVRIVFFSIIGILLIFALQGLIWLSILSGLTFLIFKIWQRSRYRNKQENEDDRTYANQNGRSYSTRSVYSFLLGLGSWVFSFLLPQCTCVYSRFILFDFLCGFYFIIDKFGSCYERHSEKRT